MMKCSKKRPMCHGRASGLACTCPKPKNAGHSSEESRHGTPDEFLEVARYTFAGAGIHLDACSEAAFNRFVKAERYITAHKDATATPWFPGAPKPLDIRVTAPPEHEPRTVIVNPPGSDDGYLVKRFWYSTCCYWTRGWISAAIWIGFNVNQRTYLQNTAAPYHPLELTSLDPNRRFAYRTPEGRLAPSPPHASYLTLLTSDPFVRRRFVESASVFGYVSNTR